MKIFLNLIVGLFLSLFSLVALANDSAVTISAGGIEFKKHPEIEMQKEILDIDPERVKVSYEFFNRSKNDIRETVSFPLPKIQSQSNEYNDLDPFFHLYDLIESAAQVPNGKFESSPGTGEGNVMEFLISRISSRNLLDFVVQSNGVKLRPHLTYLSLLPNGKNISSDLLEMGIPLSKAYLQGWESSPALERFPKWLKLLKTKKYVDPHGKPLWTNQVVYLWSDLFPAQKKHSVSHEYRPGAGLSAVDCRQKEETSQLDSIEQCKFSNSDLQWKDFCASPDTLIQLKKILGENKILSAREVRYVLKTGANWAGFIQFFNLDIHPPKNGLAVFCWHGKSNQALSIQEKNFTPNEDLRVLFVSRD